MSSVTKPTVKFATFTRLTTENTDELTVLIFVVVIHWALIHITYITYFLEKAGQIFTKILYSTGSWSLPPVTLTFDFLT